MHYEYESDDSHNLRSGKRYKVDKEDQFDHHRSHSSETQVKSPHNPRKKRSFIPPTPQKSFVNPLVASQTFPRGQNPPIVHNT